MVSRALPHVPAGLARDYWGASRSLLRRPFFDEGRSERSLPRRHPDRTPDLGERLIAFSCLLFKEDIQITKGGRVGAFSIQRIVV